MSEPFMQRFFKWCTIAVVDISPARILPVIHKYRYAPKNILQVPSFLVTQAPAHLNQYQQLRVMLQRILPSAWPFRSAILAFQVRGEVCSTSFTVISITMDCDFSPYVSALSGFLHPHPFNILTRQHSPYPIYPLRCECFSLGTFHIT